MSKRLLDLVAIIFFAPVLVPLIIVFGLTIRLKLGSPMLFVQERPGLNGKPFHLYKFRTMTSETGPDGELLPDAERLGTFGRMLRRFSIDELPSVMNVLKGDMSLVGPRPLLMEYLQLYSTEQARRHNVRPGITGWAQVNGRNALSWQDKFDLDVWYVDNQSFVLDLKILFMTVTRTLSGSGVSHPGEATMTRFRGND